MAHAGPMQLSQDWRILGSHGRCKNHNYLVRKSRVQLVGINLSSHNMRQDAWSLHMLGSIRGPLAPVSKRCNVLVCRCFLSPGGGNEVPLLKSAAVFLTRSQGSPLAKLIPAVGVVAFACWGLGPLVRLSRVICFRKNDSSWKKSSSYYVMTQYLQPLLLWSGAILMCRALDPVVLPSVQSQAVKQRLLNFVRSLSTVLAFAYCLSSLIQQAQKFFMETDDASGARNMGFDFAGKALYSAVWIAAVSFFMELLGFSTQKWVTAGGLGTVLLTLAGREIFTNFLSSVMIHATRPFVLNEWIQTKIEGYEVSGTVEHVGWWSPTIIRGDDREAVHIPNHKFTVNVVRNLSQKTHWRIKNHIAISHLDVNKINCIVADMRKVLSKNPQVEQQRLHRRVFLENIDPENQALMILISCFVKTSHFEEYLCVKEAILLDLLRVVSHHGARLATPIRTVQKIYNTPDLENVPFSDTIFSRSKGTATNRQYLLVEPSYKVNGDDKVKAPGRPRQSEDKEAQPEPASKLDPKTNDPVSLNSKDPKKSQESALKVDDQVTLNSKDPQKSQESAPKVDDQVALNSKDPLKTQELATNLDSKIDDHVSLSTKDPLKAQASATNLDDQVTLNTKDLLNGQESGPDGSSLKAESTTTEDSGKDDSKESSEPEEEPKLPTTSNSPTKHAFQENIILGVALDGSKRMLPIEEDSSSPDSKELAPQNLGKDTKDSAS